ncbi:helix-turn-helix domain-containing protein [Streptomyces sp. NPDC001770]
MAPSLPGPSVSSQGRPHLTLLGRRASGAVIERLRISVLESGGSYDSHDPADSQCPGDSVHPGLGQVSVPPWLSDSGNGETVYVAQHVHGATAVPHNGTEVPLEPGDIVFCGPGTRAFPHPGDAYRMTVFHVPRHLLAITEPDLRRILGTPLRCTEGVGALVSHLLSALVEEGVAHRSPRGDLLVANAVEFLAALVAERAAKEHPAPSDPGTRLAARIQDHIELHLAEPDLSPGSIARAHHISVRYLHKLFQEEGTTVSRLIRRRRLEACRRELGRSPHRRLTVAAVAQRWGFVSPSHFSRAFRDAYGMSPSEWQSSAASEQALPGRSFADRALSGRTGPPAGNRSRPAGEQRGLSA